MGHVANPNYVGSVWRARNDDGPSEAAPPTGATWVTARGVNWGQLVDTNFRVRMLVYSVSTTSDALNTLELGASLNGGAYFTVKTTTSILKLSSTSHYANNDPTSDWAGRIGNRKLYPQPMTGLVDGDDAGWTFENKSVSHNLNELEFEAEFSLQIVSGDVSDGDTIDLRIFQTPLGAFLNGYDVTARMTVASVPAITNTPATTAPVGVNIAEQMTASGSVLTWSLTVAPVGATIDPATGLIAWTPPEKSEGDRIDFTAVVTTLVGSDTLSWQVCVTAPQMTGTRQVEPALTAKVEI